MSAPATRSNSRFNSDFPPLSRSSKKAGPVDFSESETEDSPPPDNEVQLQEVYSGDDVDKARKICEKDSEGYEYLHKKSQKDKKEQVKTTIYHCTAAECPCEMRLIQPIVRRKGRGRGKSVVMKVVRIGEHILPGEQVNHPPLPRRNFRWADDQKDFMADYVKTHSVSSPSVVLQELKKAGMDCGAQKSHVRNFFVYPLLLHFATLS